MKFLPNNHCFIFKEKFYFNEKDNFSLFFNQFIQQIQNYKFNNQNQLKTFYSLKKLRYEKINLNFYSFCIRIYKNLEIIKEINLPINIIPFYFSINFRNFIFFISRILIFENNEIYLEKNLIEKTINECDRLIDFQMVCKITGKFDAIFYGDTELNEKCVRVFAGDSTLPNITKRHSNTKVKHKISNTPEHVFIDNTDIHNKKVPAKLNKQFYIDLANKRLKEFV